MPAVRYESLLIERALCREYASQLEGVLKEMEGLNDIKSKIRDFETLFAGYLGVKNAVAVNSGSDGLKMALLAAGVGRGHEVIIPDLTYPAVALAVLYCGATPVPVDACEDSLQADPLAVARALTSKTKAVIAAHMFGRPCDVIRVGKLCRERNIVLIEDVCQAQGTRWRERLLGSFGDLAVFSFSYYKPLSTCGGGGGMVVFNKDRWNDMRRWMDDWRDDKELLKTGQRFAPLSLMDLIALRVKFSHLDEIEKSRYQVKAFYEDSFRRVKGVTFFKDGPQTQSVAQNFVILCRERDALVDFLGARGVMIQKPYLPLHRLSLIKGFRKTDFPVAEHYAATALHLPLYSFMGLPKAKLVVDNCISFLKAHGKVPPTIDQ